MNKGNQHKRNPKAILTLAENVKKYRKQRNITIMELAALVGVDYSQIGRIERGTVNTSVSIIFDIADALNISASSLLEPY